jgi:hypothetical protein
VEAKPRWWNGRGLAVAGLVSAGITVYGAVNWEKVLDFWFWAWPNGHVGLLLGALAYLAWHLIHGRSRRSPASPADDMSAPPDAPTPHDPDGAEARLLEADRSLLDRFLQLLPSDGRSMQWARHHNFGGSYDQDVDEELRIFLHSWDDAEHQFHNAGVEQARRELWEADQSLLTHLAVHAFVKEPSGRYQIYPDVDLELNRTAKNEFAHVAVEEADELASALWRKHQDFVTKARTVLGT